MNTSHSSFQAWTYLQRKEQNEKCPKLVFISKIKEIIIFKLFLATKKTQRYSKSLKIK